jgi:hypothetical protein
LLLRLDGSDSSWKFGGLDSSWKFDGLDSLWKFDGFDYPPPRLNPTSNLRMPHYYRACIFRPKISKNPPKISENGAKRHKKTGNIGQKLNIGRNVAKSAKFRNSVEMCENEVKIGERNAEKRNAGKML